MKFAILAIVCCAVAVAAAGADEFKPAPVKEFASKTAKLIAENTPPMPKPIVLPANAPILPSALPLNTQWNFVQSPIVKDRSTLPVIELTPVTQTYNVHSTKFSTENIKQPITEPVFQPYLQRYVQQAQPIVQPVVQRVIQPVIHRQMNSFMQTLNQEAPKLATITNAAKSHTTTNQPIRGADLMPVPISKSVERLSSGVSGSGSGALPIVGLAKPLAASGSASASASSNNKLMVGTESKFSGLESESESFSGEGDSDME